MTDEPIPLTNPFGNDVVWIPRSTYCELLEARAACGRLELENESLNARLAKANEACVDMEALRTKFSRMKYEVGEVVRTIPNHVIVREGGSFEDVVASLAVSVSKSNDMLEQGNEMVKVLLDLAEHHLPLKRLVEFVIDLASRDEGAT